MSDIIAWSATETAQHITNKSVSVAEITDAHIAHAERVNASLNFMTEDTFELARSQAKELDNTRTETLPTGFGLPVTTKSNVDQKDVPNSNGIPAFANNICDQDSAVVANIRKSGAVMFARTNTPEFSMRWCTSNPLHGVSLNPWDASKTPGGSSGAAAAAIASGVGVLAHGNDLGGSLRYPAYCCGVVSIRPSMGRVPGYNPGAPTERPSISGLMSVNGPIARSVADTRLGLQMMAQPDLRDPNNIPNATPANKRDGKPVIGISYDTFGDGIESEVSKAVELAENAMRSAGFTVKQVEPPSAKRVAELWGELLFTEGAHTQRDMIAEFGSPAMNRLIDGYLSSFKNLDIKGLIDGLSERITLQRQWALMFSDIDILIMPTSGILPFENDLDFNNAAALPKLLKAQKFLCAINLLGLPSVAVPTHLANGLPVGVQLVAPMHDDYFALDIAEVLENHLGSLLSRLPENLGQNPASV